MKAKELAERLLKNPEAEVLVWDAYNDRPDTEVHVTTQLDGSLMVSNWKSWENGVELGRDGA